MEFLRRIVSSDGLMPHGFCYLWTPGLIWLHVISDSLITLAYSSIPLTLLYFIQKRKDLPFNWMFVCFGAFILACGATHAMEVWTIWHATYWMSGMVKLVTAVVSVATAVLLVKSIPQALALPSPEALRIEVSQRRLAEEALSRANGRLIQAHEEERTRIARELHDDIAQRVSLLALQLDGMSHDGQAPAAHLAERIREAQKQTRDLGHDVQALSHRLHSSKLEYVGLESAVRTFCKELSDRSGVAIAVHAGGIPNDLPEDVALCLFRVLQEAAQNATKHSGSRRIEVSLTRAGNDVHLLVRDAGNGFDPEHALMERGLGLISMKERLKLVGGELSIESQPRRGTTIRARVQYARRVVAPGASLGSASAGV